MYKFRLVAITPLIAISFMGLIAALPSAQAEQAPALKLDLREAIKKSLSGKRFGYRRSIRATGTVVAILKADLVTVNFKVSAQGENAGEIIALLDQQKQQLITASKDLGIEIVSTASSSLRVRASRSRSFFKNSENTKGSFIGSLAVILTFKAGKSVLGDVGKIAGDRVSGVGRMKFSFSDEEWQKQTAGLKKRAIEKALANAVKKAALQGNEIKSVRRSNVSLPRYKFSNQQQQLVRVQVTARMNYNVE